MVAIPRICVGRREELATMSELLTSARTGRSAFFLVQGDTGVGKSTLLREFVANIERSVECPVVAWGHCDPQIGKGRPLLPWTGVLESLAGVSEIAVPEEKVRDERGVLRRARTAFTELAPDVVDLLLPAFGLVLRSARLISRKTSLGRRLARGTESADSGAVGAAWHLRPQQSPNHKIPFPPQSRLSACLPECGGY